MHNSLKEGLTALGHEVTIIATGDYFKKYPVDIKLELKYQSGFMKYLKVGLYNLFGVDIASNSIRRQFFSHKEHLKGYDVVQLINESPFGLLPKIEIALISFLKKHNKKLFLLSCGTDYLSVKFALGDTLPYTILYDYKNGKLPKKLFVFILKYTQPSFKELHEFVYDNMNGVIASDIDYHLPLKGHPKYLGLIPNPVNINKLSFIELSSEGPITIFMGVNKSNSHTKGIHYFEEALEIVSKKYSEKIIIEKVENLPYKEYIEKYNNAHIILDQALGYDQGYNALEAMAKGKVVFTGAEVIFEQHYNITEKVAINAVPNASTITEELERLILNRSTIHSIGKNARKFVENEHHYIKIAEKYIAVWKAN